MMPSAHIEGQHEEVSSVESSLQDDVVDIASVLQESQVMENIKRHDQQVMVQHNVAPMPSTSRVALRLRFLHERTYEEMAHILAMPLGTIKTTLFRAKRLLKERVLAQHRESTL